MKFFENFGRKCNEATSPKPAPATEGIVLENAGYCHTCSQEVKFVARNSWLRDHYLCSSCGSIPRERALMLTIEKYFPNWPQLRIHESSPCGRGASVRLARECKGYLASQFFPGVTPGELVHGVRCEDLENLTFPNESLDLHVTQDVMEHVFHPAAAFREIARTLTPGGAHVFTTPLVRKHQTSRVRARIDAQGKISHLEPAQHHGNPISDQGSLVTVDWGFDITRHIFEACGLFTHLIYIDDPGKGIRAEYIEVLVTVKPRDNQVGNLNA